MVPRMLLSVTVLLSRTEPDGGTIGAERAGTAACGAALAAGAPPEASADSTSLRTMRPDGPDPVRAARSRSCSSAILRASGEAKTREPPAFDACPLEAWALSSVAVSAGAG